jgi:RNase P subunit RPR2
MGIGTHRGTMPGAVTPICNECNTFLCWDLSEDEAAENQEFWDAWICQDCNGGERMSLKQWQAQRAGTVA